MNMSSLFMRRPFRVKAVVQRAIISSSLLMFSSVSVAEDNQFGQWYTNRLEGTMQLFYNKGVENLLGAYYGKAFRGFFPFAAITDSTPAWVEGLFDRLDEMESNILESIAEVRQDIKSEDLKAAIQAVKEGSNAYQLYMIPSYAVNGSRNNEFGDPTPLPMDRARFQNSETHINNSIQNLNKAIIILTSFLADKDTKGQYDDLRRKAAIILRAILPYYVDLTSEYYNTYKWYKNSRENAFQQDYDVLLFDNVFLNNTNWVNQASNNAADYYGHFFGDIAPGEPHQYGGLNVIFTDTNPTYLQSIMETLQDEKKYEIDTTLHNSVGEMVYQDVEKVRSGYQGGTYCTSYIYKWSYQFGYETSLGSSEITTYKEDDSLPLTMCLGDSSSKESKAAAQAAAMAQQDKEEVEAYREMILENRDAEITFNINALYHPVFRSIFDNLGISYESINTEAVMKLPGSLEMNKLFWESLGYKYHPAIFLVVNEDLAEKYNISRFNYEGAFDAFHFHAEVFHNRAWFNDNVASLDNPELLTSIFTDEQGQLYGMQADTSVLHHYAGSWTTDNYLPPFNKVLQDGTDGLAITRIIPTYNYTTAGGSQLRSLGLQRDTGKLYYPNGNWWYEITDLFPGEDLFEKRFIDLSVNASNSNEWWAITTTGEIFRLTYNNKNNRFSISEVDSERNVVDGTVRVEKPSHLIRILSYDTQSWAIDRDFQLYQWQPSGEDLEGRWESVALPEEKIKQFTVGKNGTWALNTKGILHSYNNDQGQWQNHDEYFQYISVSDDYLYGILDGNVYAMTLSPDAFV